MIILQIYATLCLINLGITITQAYRLDIAMNVTLMNIFLIAITPFFWGFRALRFIGTWGLTVCMRLTEMIPPFILFKVNPNGEKDFNKILLKMIKK